ncbi:MAG: ThuA domain-containing protein [Bacillota bacterium]
MIQVTVWNEFKHEKKDEKVKEVYPEGIHNAIKEQLEKTEEDYKIQTATLDEPEHGLTEEVLDNTDVLLWWGHMAHHQVKDEIVDRVYNRVLEGMGLIVLHSAHASKIFNKLCGTNSSQLKWREIGEKERLWVIEPGHPVAEGLDEFIEVEKTEMYGERFNIPAPDTLVFISWFEGGEVFRSGCCYHRGNGKIFYFRPGHETYPVYYQDEIIQVLENAINWAAPVNGPDSTFGNVEAIEDIE